MSMKNKVSITKTLALVLCIITITLSQNIYSSFKDLYFKEGLYTENIIYTATANASLNNSLSISLDNSNMSIKHKAQPLAVTSGIKENKGDQQKKIFINVFLLFLSFITLASIHNFILKIESTRGYSYLSIRNQVKNKKSNINLTSSIAHEEGVK